PYTTLYYTRMEKGLQYGIHCRHALIADAAEQILLDRNELAHGQAYFSLAYDLPSPDGRVLAYAVDDDGSEVYTLRFKDLTIGTVLPEAIPNVYYSGAWSDNATFFYTTLDETKRPYRLWRHRVGSSDADVLVYEESDGRFNISIARARSGEFLFLTMDSHATSEVRYLAVRDHLGEFRALRPRV